MLIRAVRCRPQYPGLGLASDQVSDSAHAREEFHKFLWLADGNHSPDVDKLGALLKAGTLAIPSCHGTRCRPCQWAALKKSNIEKGIESWFDCRHFKIQSCLTRWQQQATALNLFWSPNRSKTSCEELTFLSRLRVLKQAQVFQIGCWHGDIGELGSRTKN